MIANLILGFLVGCSLIASVILYRSYRRDLEKGEKVTAWERKE